MQGMGVQPVEPLVNSAYGLSTVKDVTGGEVLLSIPGSACVTKTDVVNHDVLAPVAEGLSELVCLALWLMVERTRGAASQWAPLVQALPTRTPNPMLWKEGVRKELLQGSPVLTATEERLKELEQQWKDIESFCRMKVRVTRRRGFMRSPPHQ